MIGLDPALEDAAMDLGVSDPTTLRRITVPLLGPSLLAVWLAGFMRGTGVAAGVLEAALERSVSGLLHRYPTF